jgi:hypothetical protein
MPTDIDADGELTYWSPALSNGGPGGTSDVVQTATGLVSLPYTNNAFFTPNGTGSHDGSPNGFQAAYFYGTLDAPTAEKISFSVSSDDMAFVYLDGTVVCNDGGVHGATAVPCTTSTVSAGDHTLQIFYVDLDPVAAVLDFSITTTGVTTSGSAVPEPGTWTLFAEARQQRVAEVGVIEDVERNRREAPSPPFRSGARSWSARNRSWCSWAR